MVGGFQSVSDLVSFTLESLRAVMVTTHRVMKTIPERSQPITNVRVLRRWEGRVGKQEVRPTPCACRHRTTQVQTKEVLVSPRQASPQRVQPLRRHRTLPSPDRRGCSGRPRCRAPSHSPNASSPVGIRFNFPFCRFAVLPGALKFRNRRSQLASAVRPAAVSPATGDTGDPSVHINRDALKSRLALAPRERHREKFCTRFGNIGVANANPPVAFILRWP